MKSVLYKLATQTGVMVVMLLMVFAPFASLTAQAQVGADTAPTAATTGNGVQTVTGGAGVGGTVSTSAQQQQTSNDILANCKNFSVSGCVASMLYVFTVGIGSAFAYVAAYFFDITIQLSLNGASYGLDFISTSWTTARDLANMAFLFILLYIAFQIILRADTSGTMSLLAGVIIVALLVNFSFFFSRVIIDAGNILTIQFYNAIPAPPISQTIQGSPVSGTVASTVNTVAGYAFSGDPAKTKDLTASIMNMIQVQNLLNNQSFNAANGSGTFNLISTIFIFIAAAIVLWLLTVAFITNGVKFLVRVVVLWFLIIVSPFAFVAAAVQGTGGYFKQWRELLLTHAFYPVAFMFIFLILNNFAITVSGGNSNLVSGVFSTGTNLTTWSAIGAALVSVAIRIGLVIAVLFIGMRASDRISVYGSSAAGKAGNWFGGKFIGAYGAAGRSTFGRAAYNLSQNSSFQNAAAKSAVVGTLWRGTNSVAKSSFDARGGLKSAGVKDIAGVNMAGINKGGYKGAVDARVKAKEEQAKQFGGLSDEQKAKIKADAENKHADEKASIQAQIVSVTAQRDAAKEIEDRAKTELDNAKEEAETAQRNFKNAGDKKEPQDVINVTVDKRDAAERKVVQAQKEFNTHSKTRETFSSKIQDLTSARKATDDKISKEIKAEETKATPKNIFADKLDNKNGRGGFMAQFGWIPTADKKAAANIRKEKSKDQKLIDAVKDYQGDEVKVEPAAPKKEDKKDDHH